MQIIEEIRNSGGDVTLEYWGGKKLSICTHVDLCIEDEQPVLMDLEDINRLIKKLNKLKKIIEREPDEEFE